MTDKELIQALRCENGNCLSCGLADVCFSLDAQVADRLEALLAENEHLREDAKMVPRWISVGERLPELSYSEYNKIERCGHTGAPEFLVQIVGGRMATTLHYDGENWLDEECATYLVEYWAELPRIPAADQLGLPITQH